MAAMIVAINHRFDLVFMANPPALQGQRRNHEGGELSVTWAFLVPPADVPSYCL